MKFYINILGLSGSGKTSLIKNQDYIYNKYCQLLLTNYGKKGIKEKIINNLKYNFMNLNDKNEILKIINIYKSQSKGISNTENYKLKFNIINKLVIHRNTIKYKKNVIIDEGVLSLFDNLIIHPKLINQNYNIRRYLDALTILPSHVIYLSETPEVLINRYRDRNDKPWKINEKYNLEEYFKNALTKYDKYIDMLVNNYNISLIEKDNIKNFISQ